MSEANDRNPIISAAVTESGAVITAAHAGGRPTDYTPERGEEVIAWMRQGYSLAAAAGAMGFARQTLYNWMQEHREFLESVSRAKAMRTFKLETDLLGSENGPVINARRFALINAAPEDWREQRTINHDTPADGPFAIAYREIAGRAIRPKE